MLGLTCIKRTSAAIFHGNGGVAQLVRARRPQRSRQVIADDPRAPPQGRSPQGHLPGGEDGCGEEGTKMNNCRDFPIVH